MLLLTRMLRWHRRPWLAWCVVASLLLSPLVGHMHAVAHAGLHAPLPHSAAAPASAAHPSFAHTAAHHHAAPAHGTLLATLFADHALLDCLTLDQLSLGDSPPPALWVPTPCAAAALDAPPPATHALPLRTAHAWARGPPVHHTPRTL